MYIIAEEFLHGSIGYYKGTKKGKGVEFESGAGSTEYAIKYKTFSGAERAMVKLKKNPGVDTAKLFIMPEDVYTAYEEWFDRRAERLRREHGII